MSIPVRSNEAFASDSRKKFKSVIWRILDIPYSIIVRVFSRPLSLLSYLEQRRISYQFKSFGVDSTIYGPVSLRNPQYVEIGERVIVNPHSRWDVVKARDADSEPRVVVGDGTSIGHYFVLGCCNYVELGKDTLIAPSVIVTDAGHIFENPDVSIIEQGVCSKGPIIIEEGCWLGYGCAVLGNVRIGRNSVIDANAVVTEDIPPLSVAVGNPARVVRQYDPVLGKWIRPGMPSVHSKSESKDQ